MQLQVTFRNVTTSAALEARIRELAQKLQEHSRPHLKSGREQASS